MHVIIPLAGFGTRMRPHTFSKPKPLINVAGKAVLGHILDRLARLNVQEITFIVGYMGDQIEAFVEKNYHFKARYVEQKELLGQAHALGLAKEYIDGPVLIVFVDTLFETDLSVLQDESADGVIYVKEVQDPRRFGVVELDEDNYITRFIEKPTTFDNRLAVIGLYYLKDGPGLMTAIDDLFTRDIQAKGEYWLADALQIVIEKGARLRIQTVDVWEDCGKPETVLHTNRYLLNNGHDNSFEAQRGDVIIVPPVHIAPTAIVTKSVIGPYATIAEGCHISHAIIRDSIVDAGARIENTMLDESLIGKQATVTGRYRKLNVGDSSNIDST